MYTHARDDFKNFMTPKIMACHDKYWSINSRHTKTYGFTKSLRLP